MGLSAKSFRRSVFLLLLLSCACSDTPVEPEGDPGDMTETDPEPKPLNELGSIFFLSDREYGGTPTSVGRSELFVIRPDGSEERQLTNNDTLYNIARVTSAHPSGRSVLFEGMGVVGSFKVLDVVSADLDGTVTPLTDNLERGDWIEWPVSPEWSPDGSSFLASVQNSDTGEWTIYSYSADGSQRTPLSRSVTINDWHGAWSPKGEWISFNSATNKSDWHCWVMRPDGSRRRQILFPGVCSPPVWSPDGSHVVFSATPNRATGEWALWQADANGSNAKLIVPSTPVMQDMHSARYSPNGKRLAFVAVGAYGTEDIFIASSDGTGVHPLVTSEGQDRDFSFSPDGRYIAFTTSRFDPRGRDSFKELMVQAVDGGEPVRITFTGYNRQPLWVSGR